MVEELLSVHQGQAKKDEVFAEKRQVYEEYFKKMGQQDTLISDSNKVISTTWADFSKLKQSV